MLVVSTGRSEFHLRRGAAFGTTGAAGSVGTLERAVDPVGDHLLDVGVEVLLREVLEEVGRDHHVLGERLGALDARRRRFVDAAAEQHMRGGIATWQRVERVFQEHGQEIACLIMEPAMMNIGIVVPQPGYLQRVRELCTKYGVVFIFRIVR